MQLRLKVRDPVMCIGISVCGISLHRIVWHKHIKRKRYKSHPRTPWRRCGAGVELPWKSVWPPGRAEAAWGRWRCVYRLTYRPSGPLYPERQRKPDRWNIWLLVCFCLLDSGCHSSRVERSASWKTHCDRLCSLHQPGTYVFKLNEPGSSKRADLNCYISQRKRTAKQEWPFQIDSISLANSIIPSFTARAKTTSTQS